MFMKKLNLILSGICFGVLLICGCKEQKNAIDYKKLADQYSQALNAHDPKALAGFYAEDAVVHQPDATEPLKGRDAIEKIFAGYFITCPDLTIEFVTVICTGDQVAFEYIEKGTFTGPMVSPEGEIAPTGKSFTVKGAFFARINPDGLIVEDRTYYDQMSFMNQLGVAN